MNPSEMQCKKIGGKIVNNVCMVNGYPAATGEQIDTPIIHKMIHECEILHLRPEDFLKLVPETIIEKAIVEDLKQKIQNKAPLDLPWIKITSEECGWRWKLPCITNHEGRHRAVAAQKLNLKKLPVLLCKE
jgi:hypothetical protein